MKAIKYLSILATSVLIFNACTKQVAGPTGPTGSTGLQGPSAAGYVTIDTIVASKWASGPNPSEYITSVGNITGLTSPNADAVYVYCSTSFNSLSTWQGLEAYSVFVPTDYLTCSYSTNVVMLQYYGSSAPSSVLFLKTVVIPESE